MDRIVLELILKKNAISIPIGSLFISLDQFAQGGVIKDQNRNLGRGNGPVLPLAAISIWGRQKAKTVGYYNFE